MMAGQSLEPHGRHSPKAHLCEYGYAVVKNALAGCRKKPICCVALIMLHCGVQKVRLILHDFARLASEHF